MNDILHDAESGLYQKLLVANIFPGIILIGNIFVTKYATTVKKYFCGATMPDKSLVYIAMGNSRLSFVLFLMFKSVDAIFNEKQ